jgi:hypothetical protein
LRSWAIASASTPIASSAAPSSRRAPGWSTSFRICSEEARARAQPTGQHLALHVGRVVVERVDELARLGEPPGLHLQPHDLLAHTRVAAALPHRLELGRRLGEAPLTLIEARERQARFVARRIELERARQRLLRRLQVTTRERRARQRVVRLRRSGHALHQRAPGLLDALREAPVAIELRQRQVGLFAAAVDLDGPPQRRFGAGQVATQLLDSREHHQRFGELRIEVQRSLHFVARLVDAAEREQLLGQAHAQVGRSAVGGERVPQRLHRLVAATFVGMELGQHVVLIGRRAHVIAGHQDALEAADHGRPLRIWKATGAARKEQRRQHQVAHHPHTSLRIADPRGASWRG